MISFHNLKTHSNSNRRRVQQGYGVLMQVTGVCVAHEIVRRDSVGKCLIASPGAGKLAARGAHPGKSAPSASSIVEDLPVHYPTHRPPTKLKPLNTFGVHNQYTSLETGLPDRGNTYSFGHRSATLRLAICAGQLLLPLCDALHQGALPQVLPQAPPPLSGRTSAGLVHGTHRECRLFQQNEERHRK